MNDDGFARHEREQVQRWASLTPAQRLNWLSEAKLLARQALDAAKARAAARAQEVEPGGEDTAGGAGDGYNSSR